jgi:hypothetical protein
MIIRSITRNNTKVLEVVAPNGSVAFQTLDDGFGMERVLAWARQEGHTELLPKPKVRR